MFYDISNASRYTSTIYVTKFIVWMLKRSTAFVLNRFSPGFLFVLVLHVPFTKCCDSFHIEYCNGGGGGGGRGGGVDSGKVFEVG